jgi:hypothetical protein
LLAFSHASSPLCRGGVVLHNIDVDMSGFREALLVDGAAAPLLLGCRFKCSGDDTVATGSAGETLFGASLGRGCPGC